MSISAETLTEQYSYSCTCVL